MSEPHEEKEPGRVTYVDEKCPSAELPKRPRMPPEIAKAIVAVMAKIEPLTKDAENTFQRYKYVSVDQFFEAVGKPMAEAGIFVVAFEDALDVSKRQTSNDRGDIKESVWLTATYDLFLYHVGGAEFGPVRRTITVPASGAQSYASAMSYVEKYFLRNLFKIPTGDGDADGDEKRDLPSNDRRERPPQGERPDEALEGQKAFLAQAKRDWEKHKTSVEHTEWWNTNKQRLTAIYDNNQNPLYIELKDAFAERGRTLVAASPKTEDKDALPNTLPGQPAFDDLLHALESSLRLCVDLVGCNAAYVQYIEKWEKGLTPEQLRTAGLALKARADKLAWLTSPP